MKRYALLVGINRYANEGFLPLKYAERDATKLARELESRCGFQTCVLTGEQATRDAIHTVLESGRLTPGDPAFTADDLFLFFFAGHGQLLMPGGRFTLHAHDGRINSAGRSLPVGTVMDLMESNVAASRCVCILDACRNVGIEGAHDEAVFDADGSRDITAAVSKVTRKTVRLLFACREGERSYEDKRYRHGVLTHFLLQSLQECDPARGLTFGDLTANAAEMMATWRHSSHGSTQRPRIFGDPARIELVPPVVADSAGPEREARYRKWMDTALSLSLDDRLEEAIKAYEQAARCAPPGSDDAAKAAKKLREKVKSSRRRKADETVRRELILCTESASDAEEARRRQEETARPLGTRVEPRLVEASKAAVELAREKKLDVKGGWADGRTLTQEDVRQLSALPSRKMLLAQIAGLAAAPLGHLVGMIGAPAASLARALRAWNEKRGGPGGQDAA